MSTAVTENVTERYRHEFPNSAKLYEQAQGIFPGGVTHDLRYLQPFPIYVERAEGAYKWDVDGHKLIDYWSGHGAILLGHSAPAVVRAVQEQMARATHPGACHELEIEWGQWVQKLIASAEKVRFVSSGTEATLMALRLARIATGKPKVLKFLGHFHGWQDYLVPASDPPYESHDVPGVPQDVAGHAVIIPPNDPELVERTLGDDPDIGCVILEPTGGHFGRVPIRGEFLRALRDITARQQRLLIFDEVISGFRVHPGGAQGHYQVTPDLTTMAKILAGGLPGGCVAGRADILEHIAFRPGRTKMAHPGTFNANPLSASAGIATLSEVATGKPSERANAAGKSLRAKLNALFQSRQVNWVCYGEFSGWKILTDYDGPRPVDDSFTPYNGDLHRIDAPRSRELAHCFRQGMLLHGVDLPGFGGLTTSAHSDADVDATVNAVAGTLDLLNFPDNRE